MRFREERNIIEPMLDGYDLAQCVKIKRDIERYRKMRMNCFAVIFYGWMAVWGLIAGCVWVLDWAGVITYVEDEFRDLLFPLLFLLFTMCAWGMLTAGYDKLYVAVNKRINTLLDTEG